MHILAPSLLYVSNILQRPLQLTLAEEKIETRDSKPVTNKTIMILTV